MYMYKKSKILVCSFVGLMGFSGGACKSNRDFLKFFSRWYSK